MNPNIGTAQFHFTEDEKAEAKAVFLEAYAKVGNTGKAAKIAGIARRTANNWKEQDEQFAADWDDIDHSNVDTAERTVFELSQDPAVAPLVRLKAATVFLNGNLPSKYRYYGKPAEISDGKPELYQINIVFGPDPARPEPKRLPLVNGKEIVIDE